MDPGVALEGALSLAAGAYDATLRPLEQRSSNEEWYGWQILLADLLAVAVSCGTWPEDPSKPRAFRGIPTSGLDRCVTL